MVIARYKILNLQVVFMRSIFNIHRFISAQTATPFCRTRTRIMRAHARHSRVEFGELRLAYLYILLLRF